jgi:hypothetical protein
MSIIFEKSISSKGKTKKRNNKEIITANELYNIFVHEESSVFIKTKFSQTSNNYTQNIQTKLQE